LIIIEYDFQICDKNDEPPTILRTRQAEDRQTTRTYTHIVMEMTVHTAQGKKNSQKKFFSSRYQQLTVAAPGTRTSGCPYPIVTAQWATKKNMEP